MARVHGEKGSQVVVPEKRKERGGGVRPMWPEGKREL